MFTPEIKHLEREVVKVTTPNICQELRDKSKSDKEATNFLDWVTPKLYSFADSIDYQLSVGDPYSVIDPFMALKLKSQGGELFGICHLKKRKIVVSPEHQPDMQVRTMVHELAHAIGANSLHAGDDEIAAETTAWLVCKQLGFDAFDWSMPQIAVAYWSQDGTFDYGKINSLTNKLLNEVS